MRKFKIGGKIDRIVLRVVIPAAAAAAILYALFSPAVFQLDENYYFSREGIRVTGGDAVVAGRDIRLWGRYPWVYGERGGDAFLLDLSGTKAEIFSSREREDPDCRFHTVVRTQGLDLRLCRSWEDLFHSAEGKKLRMELKKALSRSRR